MFKNHQESQGTAAALLSRLLQTANTLTCRLDTHSQHTNGLQRWYRASSLHMLGLPVPFSCTESWVMLSTLMSLNVSSNNLQGASCNQLFFALLATACSC